MAFELQIDGISDGVEIPTTFAFCAPTGMGDNRSPGLRWTGAPAGTASFAITCVDPDAPTDGTDVNVEGRTVPASLPRADFCHWILTGIAADVGALPEGADSDGVTPGGKPVGSTEHGKRGRNDYTAWFEGDADMAGTYGGYDGPCPPANDEIVHHYVFSVHALDVAELGLADDAGLADFRAAIDGHVLAEASVTGTYALNPEVRNG